jgi:hypothetical protein
MVEYADVLTRRLPGRTGKNYENLSRTVSVQLEFRTVGLLTTGQKFHSVKSRGARAGFYGPPLIHIYMHIYINITAPAIIINNIM